LLAYAELRAPFAGVVARKLVTAGDLAAPGIPLLELEGTSEFEVEVAIPESLTEGLAEGLRVPLSGSTGVSLGEARVKELSSTADTQARSVLAKLEVPASVKVRSGQFVRVSVPAGSVRLLSVPTSAVAVLGQMERVFVVENGRAVMRLVKTGAVHGQSIEISSGLSENERVIVSPAATLRDGQPVEVTP
jgi:RND family efflux transporter MFP subunit